MKVDTLNISDLVLTTVSIIINENVKKICMENVMYLLSLMIENVMYLLSLMIENVMYLLSLMIENVNFFYIHC
jgi:hypothetical protein